MAGKVGWIQGWSIQSLASNLEKRHVTSPDMPIQVGRPVKTGPQDGILYIGGCRILTNVAGEAVQTREAYASFFFPSCPDKPVLSSLSSQALRKKNNRECERK